MSSETKAPGLDKLAEQAVDLAKRAGAAECAVVTSRGRFIEIQYRNGQLERVRESSSASLSIDVYVDGRFSHHATTDLRPQALGEFIGRAVAMTRYINKDPHRGLADPALYRDQPSVDLGIYSTGYYRVDTERRKALAEAAMEAAREVKGPIISASGGYHDSVGEAVRIHSNGFFGTRRSTRFGIWADATIKDADGRRPQDYYSASAHRFGDLPDPRSIGRRAAERALARAGQVKLASGTMPLLIENRAASGFLSRFLDGMYGSSLQQKRSFLAGKLGQVVASPLFTLIDDPLLHGGFGSRHFDGDGISARKRVLVDRGVLKSYLIGVYYGRKLGMAPTGGGTSNLILPMGKKSPEALIAGIKKGIYVTGLLGGNSDSTSGDFSHGIVGFEIVDGKRGRAVGEMNVTGTHRTLWSRLSQVGNDPYPYSSWRIPSLVLDEVSVSGS